MTTTEQDVAALGQPLGADATANPWLHFSRMGTQDAGGCSRHPLTETWARL